MNFDELPIFSHEVRMLLIIIDKIPLLNPYLSVIIPIKRTLKLHHTRPNLFLPSKYKKSVVKGSRPLKIQHFTLSNKLFPHQASLV